MNSFKRNTKEIHCTFRVVTPLKSDQELQDWLTKQTDYRFALAHADDGVIWGYFENDAWHWSGQAFPTLLPVINFTRLQQLRLFGRDGEVLLWRADSELCGRVIVDEGDEAVKYFDEAQLLWGTAEGEPVDGFKTMREGSQGLRHAPPSAIADFGMLATRNYIAYDMDNCAYIKASRLTTTQV